MIETVINLDGVEEDFDAKKLNHWVRSVGTISEEDWNQITLEVIQGLPTKATVQVLMQKLIDALLARNTWSFYVMAGRVMAILNRIQIFGSKKIPSVRTVQKRLHDKGLMQQFDYSEYEWNMIESMIDHDRDLGMPHYALEQIRYKYSLQDFGTKEEFETPQFIYMRMAMTIFQNEPETVPGTNLENDNPSNRSRLEHIRRIYDHYSKKRLSSPTPNYNNMGTYHRGYASCCLIASSDERWSLAAADHITYMMTTQSAGIGLNLDTRTLGNKVQKGRFLHRGKLPYIATFGKNIRANLQGGRGGAGTLYFSLFDSEAKKIAGLRDTRATDTARNRDAHYAYMSNRFLTYKAAQEEMIFTWNIKTAPDLHEAFYGPDIAKFAEIYYRYEQDPTFKKEYVSARDVLLHSLQQGFGTGTIYASSIDEMNRNTPFLDPIRSSNLCVAPGSEIRTRLHGDVPIGRYASHQLEVWNGYEWTTVKIEKTSDRQKLVRVYTNIGKGFLDCTLYHKWYIIDPVTGDEKEVRTIDLKTGDSIASFMLPDGKVIDGIVLDVEDLGVENETYCFSDPIRHRGMFNGIMTGQCLEVAEPTEPYTGRNAMLDLYSHEEVGHARFEAVTANGAVRLHYDMKASDTVYTPNFKSRIVAQSVKLGMEIGHVGHDTLVVDKIHSIKKEPEVALCSLAAVNITDEMDDRTYADVMYYAYRQIDYCIDENDYILPHMGVTAKKRRNAGVGLMGVATHMARRKLSMKDPEGLKALHRVHERHMYFAIKASLQISKERGLAPWIHRTKWPDGWTPLQSYRKEVDELADFDYVYDWDELSEEIKDNGGLAHSCLVNFMPGESSSKALGATNSIYQIRKAVLVKLDADNILRWAAPYSDDPEYVYHSVWDMTFKEQNSGYAVAQKFCDQSVSADWFADFRERLTYSSTEVLEAEFDRVRKGVKTRYYINTLMPATSNTLSISQSAHSVSPDDIKPFDTPQEVDPKQQALIDEMKALGIDFENTGGDGAQDCEGCSV